MGGKGGKKDGREEKIRGMVESKMSRLVYTVLKVFSDCEIVHIVL
mgnify:CR=1 FL=1